MPTSFSPVTDFPTEQLVKEARERIQKAIQRTAYFNGVSIGVMHVTPVSGVIDSGEQYLNVQSALNGSFWGYYPDQQPPKIDWGLSNEVYQSGTMNFTISIGGKPRQATVVVIAPKSGEDLWMITASGSGEAAKLADQTARDFVFK
jgi:hypothetical protein